MSVGMKLRFQILKRDNFTCQYCGRTAPEVKLEVDHVMPKSRGGEDKPYNLVTSCYECNKGKNADCLEVLASSALGNRILMEYGIYSWVILNLDLPVREILKQEGKI